MGELTQSICSACGHPNVPGEMFCQACRVQLAPVPSIPPPPPVPVSSSAPIPPPAQSQVEPPVKPMPSQTGGIKGKLIVVLGQVDIKLPESKPELLIGRADPVRDIYPDIDLGQHGGDRQGVSRLHARMLLADGQVYIEDLNSTNFTFLNNQRLEPGMRYPIKSEDKIRLGLMSLEYRES